MVADSYTPGEELANRVTHGVGAALSLVGLVWLTTFSSFHGDAWLITGTTIFGVTLGGALHGVHACTTVFAPWQVKQLLRKFDHAAIFLLIAGSYTPFLLVTLRGPWGWVLFGVIWGLAVAAESRSNSGSPDGTGMFPRWSISRWAGCA